MPVKYEPAKVPIDTPPIEIAPIQEPNNGLNQKVTTMAIAPDDYVPIFNAKIGGGPVPPSPELLKKAVNERLENKQNQ